jgi:hypothetical protein
MLWDWWARPLSDKERVARMKRRWCEYVFQLHERPYPDNDNYESPQDKLAAIKRCREKIALMKTDPHHPEDSKHRLEWWSALANKLERQVLSDIARGCS